jgi:hypothetical protein
MEGADRHKELEMSGFLPFWPSNLLRISIASHTFKIIYWTYATSQAVYMDWEIESTRKVQSVMGGSKMKFPPNFLTS